jgi:hypothetical protein
MAFHWWASRSRAHSFRMLAVARLGIVDAIRVRQFFATNGKRKIEGGGRGWSPRGVGVLNWARGHIQAAGSPRREVPVSAENAANVLLGAFMLTVPGDY